jgi:hypothetical protein
LQGSSSMRISARILVRILPAKIFIVASIFCKDHRKDPWLVSQFFKFFVH